jgi:hypothetical protein
MPHFVQSAKAYVGTDLGDRLERAESGLGRTQTGANVGYHGRSAKANRWTARSECSSEGQTARASGDACRAYEEVAIR